MNHRILLITVASLVSGTCATQAAAILRITEAMSNGDVADWFEVTNYGDTAFQTGMVVWAHQHPRDAAAYAISLPTGEMQESAISNTAAAWASTDRIAAKAWLDSLPGSSGKQRGLERVK